MSTKGDKDRASRMAEFRDLHDEFRATGKQEVAQKRLEAMHKHGPETARRCMDVLITEAIDKRQAGKDLLRRAKWTGWSKKENQ